MRRVRPLGEGGSTAETAPEVVRKSKYGPRDGWVFDSRALAADVVFGLAALGLLLGWNEIYQRSRGNRPDSSPR